MIWVLRITFLLILTAMLTVTVWASMDTAIWEIPASVASHPWFVASLFDAYFGFLTFFAWVAYRETSWPPRAGWLIAILLLGNMAMAVYVLIILFRLPADAPMKRVLLREEEAS